MNFRTARSSSTDNLSASKRRALGSALRCLTCAGGIVIGIGGFLRWSLVFRNMPQVYANAIPDRGRPSHAVDEDVIDGEVRCCLGMPSLPALQAGLRRGFVG